MKNKKVLVTIIILLLIFIPLTIWSYTLKDQTFSSSTKTDNPKHFPYFNDALWFYNNNELISKYDCQNEACSYNVNDVINNQYAFIKDGSIYKLYNLKEKKVVKEYQNIEKVNEEDYIVKDNNLMGVLRIEDDIKELIPFSYDSIKISKVTSNKYLVKKDNLWYLIDEDNKKISGSFSILIVDFNDNVLVGKTNDLYTIYDYTGMRHSNYQITSYSLTKRGVSLMNKNYLYIYTSLSRGVIKTYNYKDTLKIEEEDNLIKVYDNDTLMDTLAIS